MPKKKGHGRPRRIEALLDESFRSNVRRKEFMALVCELHCEGKSANEIIEALQDGSWDRVVEGMKREDPWSIVRMCASLGWLKCRPPIEFTLGHQLADEYNWDPRKITVVPSSSLSHVAEHTAEKLLEMIQHFKTFGKQETVHIGFAGGRLLRKVAEQLANLLRIPAAENPTKIVFHAMVAAFSDDDFKADPNNFITYFIQGPLSVDIGFVPMAAPGIVETELRPSLRKFREIDEVYQAADKLHLIVSSGGDWQDEHSTAQTYLKEVDEGDVQELNAYPAIGDLLWQPVSQEGPISMDVGRFKFRPNTLVDLVDLPKRIERGARVLLALGPCGECGKPKGHLLDAIMRYQPKHVTDIVTNSPNVYDALAIAPDSSARPGNAR